MNEQMYVSVNDIEVKDELNNRANSDSSVIESIKKEGILVPLAVYPNSETKGKYILIAGHRRLLSAKKFNIDQIPVFVFPEEMADTVRALENIDRKQLHPLDEAEEINKLRFKGYTNEEISSMLGVSTDRIIKRARLNNLTDKAKGLLREGSISLPAAEQLAVIPSADQDKVTEHTYYLENGSAEDVIRRYKSILALSLDNMTKEFLEAEPSCLNCENNEVKELSLFPGCNGGCGNVKCFVKKLQSLAEKYNTTDFSAGYSISDSMIKLLAKHGIKCTVPQSNYYQLEYKKDKENTHAVVMLNGEVRWTSIQKKTPAKESPYYEKVKEADIRLKELEKETNGLYGKYLQEVAAAYMAKNHRGERFPVKDDLYIISKAFIFNNTDFVYHFFFPATNEDKSPTREDITGFIESLDNTKTVGLARVFAEIKATGLEYTYYSELSVPSYKGLLKGDTYISNETITMPEYADLEARMTLIASKAGKKIRANYAEAQQIVKDMQPIVKAIKEGA